MFPEFEARVLGLLQGAGRLRWRPAGAKTLQYIPYTGEVWSYLPGDTYPLTATGVYLWNASPVDLVVACPNPTDGKHLPLPAGGSLLLVPLDNSNRVAVSRKDGRPGGGVPVFWCPVEVVE
jgi:hypothetical protein